MLSGFIYIILYIGLINFFTFLLKSKIVTSYNKTDYPNFFSFLYFSCSWFLSLGIIGIVNSFLFYNDISIYYSKYVLLIFGFTGLVLLFSKKNFVLQFYFNIKLLFIKIFYKNNLFLTIIFLFICIIYINKFPILWYDIDEINQYGLYTKLASENWKFNTEIYGPFIRFGELIYSDFYGILNNNFFPKLIKFLSLLILSFSIYAICRIIKISHNLSFIALLIFLATPELSYIGLSMKTDSSLLYFELMSIIFMLLAFNFHINYNPNLLIFNFNKTVFNYFFLSVIFSGLGFSVRYSGVYLFIVNLSIIIIFSFYFNNKSSLYKFYLKKYLLLFFILFFITFCYFYNFLIYLNPFYPMQGFWTDLIPNSKFASWGGEEKLERFKYFLNINMGNPIYNFFYVLIYHSLGFEENIYNNYKFITHPISKAATGWLNPLTLVFLISFFYFKKIKLIIFLSLYFLILYIFWFNGIQYSRIFVASSTINIFIFFLIINENYRNKVLNLFNSFFKIIIIIILIFCTYYHLRSSITLNPFYLDSIYNNNIIFHIKHQKAKAPENYWDSQIKHTSNKDEESINLNFYDKINIFINNNDQKTLILHNLEYESIHVLFDKGLFVKLLTITFETSKKYIRIAKENNAKTCYLSDHDLDHLKDKINFSKIISYRNYFFYCSDYKS